MVYDYPACQSSLARINECNPLAQMVSRFLNGIELGNGYYELLDGKSRVGDLMRKLLSDSKENAPLRLRINILLGTGSRAPRMFRHGHTVWDRLLMLFDTTVQL